MPFSNHFNIGIKNHPPNTPFPQIMFKPFKLQYEGLNLLVTVSNATLLVNSAIKAPSNPISVYAHFDTGASVTSIDDDLAKHIGLIPLGRGMSITANGPRQTIKYSIDLVFQNNTLKSFQNLSVQSCDLPFNLQKFQSDGAIPKPQEFGILIGRDIMSTWQITWHGPTSTVFIAD